MERSNQPPATPPTPVAERLNKTTERSEESPPADLGRVDIQVWPFARIVVDGRTVAETRSWSDALSAGSHRLELQHACCETLVRELDIPPGKAVNIRERLVPRPARLAIKAPVAPDAGVMVDGAFSHYLREKQGEAISVPMTQDGDGRWRYDRAVTVRLFAPGHHDWVRTLTVRAGQSLSLDATLVPVSP